MTTSTSIAVDERRSQRCLCRSARRTQRRIADFLDAETARIDALTEKKRRMIELLARFVTGSTNRWPRGDPVWPTSSPISCRCVSGWSPQCENRPGAPVGVGRAQRRSCNDGGVFRPGEHTGAAAETTSTRQEFRVGEGDIRMSRASGSVTYIGSVRSRRSGARARDSYVRQARQARTRRPARQPRYLVAMLSA